MSEAQSLIEKYAHRGGAAAADAAASVAAFSTISPQHGQEVMLDLRRKTGDRMALPYTYLTAVTFDPSKGITLEFTGHQVVIHGRNLEPVYVAIVAYRASWLQELGHRHDTYGDDATVISAIEIQKL